MTDPPEPLALPDKSATFPLVALAYSSDGKVLYTVGNQGEFLARDAKSEWTPPAEAIDSIDKDQEKGTTRRTRSLPGGLRAEARERMNEARRNAVKDSGFGLVRAFSKDGNYLVTKGPVSILYVWDIRNNSYKIFRLSENTAGLTDMQFSDDGAFVAARAAGGFYLWRTSDMSYVGWSHTPHGNFSDLAFAPNSQTIALAEEDGSVRIWSTTGPVPRKAPTILTGYFEGWKGINVMPTGILAATELGVVALSPYLKQVRWYDNPSLDTVGTVPPKFAGLQRQEIVGFAVAPDGQSWGESVALDSYPRTLEKAGVARGEVRKRRHGKRRHRVEPH